MSKLLFHGKTAIITGAGGALGKSYAIELAKRGANVVVNDIYGTNDVIKEIESFGGIAISNNSDVINGKDIIDDTISRFGNVDILINNAGILRDKSFHKMTINEWNDVINVHLNGTFQLTHAVWPYMQQNKYGRIVNIGSGAGLYGNFGQANYSSAKMGIVGLTNTLAIEGEKYGINVNCVIPIAASKMTQNVLPSEILDLLHPRHITPFITYLAHEESKESGDIYEIGGGWYSKIRLQRSSGSYLGNNNQPASAEIIASNINKISDFTNYSNPKILSDSIQEMISAPLNLNQSFNEKSLDDPVELKSILECDNLMNKIIQHIDLNHHELITLSTQLNANISFIVSDQTKTITKTWLLDLKSSNPSLKLKSNDSDSNFKSDVKIICTDITLISLINGSLSPEYAYMSGKIKLAGNPSISLKIKLFLDYIKNHNII